MLVSNDGGSSPYKILRLAKFEGRGRAGSLLYSFTLYLPSLFRAGWFGVFFDSCELWVFMSEIAY